MMPMMQQDIGEQQLQHVATGCLCCCRYDMRAGAAWPRQGRESRASLSRQRSQPASTPSRLLRKAARLLRFLKHSVLRNHHLPPDD